MSERSGVPVSALLRGVLRGRRAVSAWMIAGFALLVIPPSIRERTYTVSAAFMPQGVPSSSTMASLAARFGIDVAASGTPESPAFYVGLLTSDVILGPIASGTYALRDGEKGESRQITLVDYYSPPGRSTEEREEAMVRLLRENMITVSSSAETGLVSFAVKSESVGIAQQIADRMLAAVNQFNLDLRQARARAELEFLEQRVSEASAELALTETALADFRAKNRVVPPDLEFEEERLLRRVTMAEQLYLTLSTALDDSRIQAVRATPVISVVQPPVVPATPDGRRRVSRGLAGLAIGGVLGVAFVLLVQYFQAMRRRDPELDREVAEVLRMAPLRWFVRGGRAQGRE